ncbi:MAG: orotate phosphoribosyltransferase [Gammaproteobacteria bacterium]|nr:orotate phosphoribosyltransferase [Gammaproteobacteria bacterium]
MTAASFVEFALENEALQFGEFTLKSGRISPYFFNAGKFNHGAAFNVLGQFYAETLMMAGIQFDLLFGPAYKGIPLATATSIALDSHYQRSVGVTFNRKEAKTHGEAGKLIGAPLAGRVVIVDDVITAGTAIRESMDLIQETGAEPAAILVALDRQEKGPKGESAIQEIEKAYNIPVLAIAKLENLLEFAKTHENLSGQLEQLTSYRQTYGIE